MKIVYKSGSVILSFMGLYQGLHFIVRSCDLTLFNLGKLQLCIFCFPHIPSVQNMVWLVIHNNKIFLNNNFTLNGDIVSSTYINSYLKLYKANYSSEENSYIFKGCFLNTMGKLICNLVLLLIPCAISHGIDRNEAWKFFLRNAMSSVQEVNSGIVSVSEVYCVQSKFCGGTGLKKKETSMYVSIVSHTFKLFSKYN